MCTCMYTYSLHPSSQIPILTNVTCPDFDGTDYATSGSLHILRCLYSVAYNSCSIHDIVALSCGILCIIT